MSTTVYLDKTTVVAALRGRHLDDRADWVDRTLPDRIDTGRNSALLNMLGIDTTPQPDATVPPL